MLSTPPTRAVALLTWVFLLVVVPVLFYVFHVFSQLGEVREGNLRMLAKAAQETDTILTSAVRAVSNLDCEFVSELPRRQPRLELASAGPCSNGGNPETRDTTRWSVRLRATSQGIQIWSTKYQRPAGSVAGDGGARSGNEAGRSNVEAREAHDTVVFNVLMGKVLAEIPFGESLDLLFVAWDGRVVEQHSPHGRSMSLRLTQLDSLRLAGSADWIEAAALRRSSLVEKVVVAGTEYDLLCQPMLALESEKDDGYVLLCGLVSSQNVLTQALRVAPHLALILLLVIVFAFLSWPILKLRLMSDRDRVRFGDLVFQLFGTWACVMLATILILSAGVHYQLREKSEASLKQLADAVEHNLQADIDGLTLLLKAVDAGFAAALAKQLGAERDSAFAGERSLLLGPGDTAQLRKLSNDVVRLYSQSLQWELDGKPADTLPAGNDWHGVVAHLDSVLWRRDSGRAEGAEPAFWQYRPLGMDFEFVHWSDCEGYQIFKATTRDQNTPRTNLETREYFRAVQYDRLWPSRAPPPRNGVQEVHPPPDAPPHRFVEPVRSLTTGAFRLNLSIRSAIAFAGPAANGADTDDPGTRSCPFTAAANLVPITRPVLSPGTGFAIIDDRGQAILHSDVRRALSENLFEEVRHGERLRAIVLSRSPQFMTSSYHGRPHQVFARPLQNLPWSAVTFADNELINTNTVEIIGDAFSWALIYLLVFVVLVALYLILKGPEIPRWLVRPRSSRPSTWVRAKGQRLARRFRYRIDTPTAIAVLTLSTLALAAVMFWSDRDALIVATFLIPVAVAAALFGNAFRASGSSRLRRSGQRRYRRSLWVSFLLLLLRRYRRVAAFLLQRAPRNQQAVASNIAAPWLWIAFGVVPAALFFKAALDSQNEALLRYESEALAEQIDQRTCAIEDHYRMVSLASEMCGTQPCRYPRDRLDSQRDVYASTLFRPPRPGTADSDGDQHGEDQGSASDDNASGGTGDGLDEAEPRPEDEETVVGPHVTISAPHAAAGKRPGRAERPKESWSWSLLRRYGPIYNRTAGRLRYIGDSSWMGEPAMTSRWSWHRDDDGRRFQVAPLRCGTGVTVWSQPPVTFASIVSLSWRNWRVYVLAGVLMLVLVGWTRYGARWILLGGLPVPTSPDLAGIRDLLQGVAKDSDCRILARVTSPADRAALLEAPEETSSGIGSFVRLDGSAYEAAPAARSELIGQLEEAIERRRNVLLITSRDPYDMVAAGRGAAADRAAGTQADEAGADSRRWLQLLSRFRFVHVRPARSLVLHEPSSNWQRGLDGPATRRWLDAELSALPELGDLQGELQRSLGRTTKRHALDRIAHYASGCYTSIWSSCTEEEKLVLVQLAREGVVNPKQAATVGQLLERGLLVRDPTPRVLNQSFAHFLMRVEDPEEVYRWEHHTSAMSWDHTRWLLLGFLLLVLLFLWATQRDLFNTTMIFLSASAVGLPAVLTALSRIGTVGQPE